MDMYKNQLKNGSTKPYLHVFLTSSKLAKLGSFLKHKLINCPSKSFSPCLDTSLPN